MKKMLSFCLIAVAMMHTNKSFAQAPALKWLDLTPAGIPAMIQVPTGVKIIADPYDVIIGDGKSIKIQLLETSQTFAQVVSFTENNDVRGFVKFTQKETNGFIAEMNAFGSKEFDFTVFATIGEKSYLVQDVPTIHNPDAKPVIAMYNYAKTIKPTGN
jgi:hypothetical protein